MFADVAQRCRNSSIIDWPRHPSIDASPHTTGGTRTSWGPLASPLIKRSNISAALNPTASALVSRSTREANRRDIANRRCRPLDSDLFRNREAEFGARVEDLLPSNIVASHYTERGSSWLSHFTRCCCSVCQARAPRPCQGDEYSEQVKPCSQAPGQRRYRVVLTKLLSETTEGEPSRILVQSAVSPQATNGFIIASDLRQVAITMSIRDLD